jgi:F-type H+-transporting ATPase subunit b
MQQPTKKTRGWIPLLGVALVLALAGLAYASGGGVEATHGAVPKSLSPEKLKDLLYRAMNFAGLVVILVWALKKPFSTGLANRRQGISDQFAELEAQRAEAERKYKEFEAKLATMDQEATAILVAARAQGEAEKQRIIADAERAAGDIKRQASLAVQHELAEATKRLREEMAEQAVVMAESIIKKSLTDADQSRLLDDYLAKIGGLHQ